MSPFIMLAGVGFLLGAIMGLGIAYALEAVSPIEGLFLGGGLGGFLMLALGIRSFN